MKTKIVGLICLMLGASLVALGQEGGAEYVLPPKWERKALRDDIERDPFREIVMDRKSEKVVVSGLDEFAPARQAKILEARQVVSAKFSDQFRGLIVGNEQVKAMLIIEEDVFAVGEVIIRTDDFAISLLVVDKEAITLEAVSISSDPAMIGTIFQIKIPLNDLLI